MAYGGLAAASRMLIFFPDLAVKESAYKEIIESIDDGYPFSTLETFLSGDIEPRPQEGYNFANSYYFYKSILNQKKGSQKWADHYLAKMDQENFPKYRFFLALQSYRKNDLAAAEGQLAALLKRDYPNQQAPFVRKVARTLARLHFDREHYEKSFDIFRSFLLRTDAVTPADWLEASWSLYHLGRYSEALGMLYNLESKAASESILFEKYTLRALIYRATCDVQSFEALIETFERDFGATIQGLKRGEPLVKFAVLRDLAVPGNEEFRRSHQMITALKEESERVNKLSEDERALANYVYDSELKIQQRLMNEETEAALDRAASHIVMMSEHLRFLRFDVARERFNPDAVFQSTTAGGRSTVSDLEGSGFLIRWMQLGDYWRGERLNYFADVRNRCAE